MRHTITLGAVALAASVVVAASGPVWADQTQSAVVADSVSGGSYLNSQPRRRRSQPPSFGQTLRPEPRANRPPAVDSGATRVDEPRVVCGMTLLPGNPAVDPGISARISLRDMGATIRAVEPPICWDTSSRR